MQKPNIFYFNPTCELAIANGSFSYMPPLLLQEMESDLSALPYIYATSNDIVLTENPPSPTFKQILTEAGFELPNFCCHEELVTLSNTSFNSLFPWGWSSAAHFRLKEFKGNCSDEFRSNPVSDWKDQYKTVFERETSLKLLSEILKKNQSDWMINKNLIGIKVTSLEEIESILNKLEAIVLKSPLSSSGRGIQIIRKKQLNNSNRQWISGIFKQQNYLIAEPFLDKRVDLSFQYKITSNSEVEYLGHSVFETNTNGQYIGTLIHPNLVEIIPELDIEKLNSMIGTTAKMIQETLIDSEYAVLHRGYIGVDAMIFNDHEHFVMQPCIEVNCRMNMGILALHLENRIHTESFGIFKLFTGQLGEFNVFVAEQSKMNPVRLKEGRIYSGFIPLTEPDKSKKFGAYTTLGVAK